jgi:uncharacterized protein YoaH (UPF0181 family)
LESYFDGLDPQIHKQERKHVSEVLQRLSGSGSSSGDAARDTAARGRDSRNDGKGRRRDNSMLRLLEKVD